MRKSQITVFIIIGIVIVMIFISMFYLRSISTNAKLESEIKKVNSQIIANSALKYYVNLCVDKATKDALRLVGSQGGAIYKTQGGLVPDDPALYVDFKPINLSYAYLGKSKLYYAETLPLLVPEGVARPLPYYPCQCQGCSSFRNPLCVTPLFCDFQFQNPCFFRYSTFYYTTGHSRLALIPLENSNISIKSEMEAYIANRTKECVELENLLHIGSGFTVAEGDIKVNVSFTDRATIADVTYPIVVKWKRAQREASFIKYSAKVPVRLKIIYKILNESLYHDANDFNYSLLKGFNEITRFYGKYGQLTLHKVAELTDNTPFLLAYPVMFNDVFSITDIKSSIDGQIYNFTFARQNRYPSLDYIGSRFHEIKPRFFKGTYDFLLSTGEELTITPKAFDLDEDNLTYNYSLWREDYLDYFDYSKAEENNCYEVPENCTFRLSSAAPPHNWTNSQLYLSTKKDAVINLTLQDVGYHVINVSASDGVYSDWQLVRVLVADKPVCKVNVYNLYKGVPNNTISVEDPLILDSMSSFAFFCPPHYRVWQDTLENTSEWNNYPASDYLYFGQEPLIFVGETVPRRWSITNPVDPNITNMGGAFNNYGGEGQYFKEHELIFSLKNSCGLACYLKVPLTVSQCIPYRSNYSEFPFHNVPGDPYRLTPDMDNLSTPINEASPFYANHTCCVEIGGFKGKWADTSTVCYNYNRIMCGRPTGESLPPAKYHEFALQHVTPTVVGGPANLKLAENDIYNRTFTVTCDGRHGNICNGTHTDKYVHLVSCKDPDISKGEVASCEGCGTYNYVTNSLECRRYTGTTFEYENRDVLTDYKGNPPTPACNPVKKCSSTSVYNTGITSADGYLCEATCNNGECNKPFLCKKCSLDDHYTCIGGNFYLKHYGCKNKGPLPAQDECTDEDFPDTLQWQGCGTFTSTRSRYCDYPPGQEGYVKQCSSNECCNIVNGKGVCTDPCRGADEECVQGRVCTAGADSCSYRSSQKDCSPVGYGYIGHCGAGGQCEMDFNLGHSCSYDTECNGHNAGCFNDLMPDGNYGSSKHCCNYNCNFNGVCKNLNDVVSTSKGNFRCTPSGWIQFQTQ